MPGVEIFQREDLAKLANSPPNLIFNTAIEFSEFVETLAVRDETTITSVIVDYCEIYDLEYESLAKMLTSSVKDKIAAEMQDAGLLARVNRLEFED
jgi:hypothetical protein